MTGVRKGMHWRTVRLSRCSGRNSGAHAIPQQPWASKKLLRYPDPTRVILGCANKINPRCTARLAAIPVTCLAANMLGTTQMWRYCICSTKRAMSTATDSAVAATSSEFTNRLNDLLDQQTTRCHRKRITNDACNMQQYASKSTRLLLFRTVAPVAYRPEPQSLQ